MAETMINAYGVGIAIWLPLSFVFSDVVGMPTTVASVGTGSAVGGTATRVEIEVAVGSTGSGVIVTTTKVLVGLGTGVLLGTNGTLVWVAGTTTGALVWVAGTTTGALVWVAGTTTGALVWVAGTTTFVLVGGTKGAVVGVCVGDLVGPAPAVGKTPVAVGDGTVSVLVNGTVDSSDVFEVLESDTGVMIDEGDKVTGIDISGVGDETSATSGFDHLLNPQTPRPSA